MIAPGVSVLDCDSGRVGVVVGVDRREDSMVLAVATVMYDCEASPRGWMLDTIDASLLVSLAPTEIVLGSHAETAATPA